MDLMSKHCERTSRYGAFDAWISRCLGMDEDEILRLKQITGLAELFRDVNFGQAWKPADPEEE